jgi:hypothetical protein
LTPNNQPLLFDDPSFDTDADGAATLLGVGRTRLSQMTSNAELPYLQRKVGTRFRLFYRRSDIEARLALRYRHSFSPIQQPTQRSGACAIAGLQDLDSFHSPRALLGRDSIDTPPSIEQEREGERHRIGLVGRRAHKQRPAAARVSAEELAQQNALQDHIDTVAKTLAQVIQRLETLDRTQLEMIGAIDGLGRNQRLALAQLLGDLKKQPVRPPASAAPVQEEKEPSRSEPPTRPSNQKPQGPGRMKPLWLLARERKTVAGNPR